MEECKKGNHPLVEITRNRLDHLADQVVRWCPECGAVVADIDVDNRTNAGQIMKMKVPRVAKERAADGSI